MIVPSLLRRGRRFRLFRRHSNESALLSVCSSVFYDFLEVQWIEMNERERFVQKSAIVRGGGCR
jgi:hypothetical protein